MTIKAVVIQPGGETTVEQLEEDDLQTLKNIVGGWLEALYGAHNERGEPQVTIFINEEGKLLSLPINSKATALWYAVDPQAPRGTDALCGTVVVMGGADPNGNLLSIPEEIAEMLTA